MLITIARRFLERRSIFAADRGHIHHRLLDMGLTHRRSVLALYMLCVVFTVVALVTYFGRSWQIGFALFTLIVLLVGVVRFVGYFSTAVNVADSGGDAGLSALLRRSVPRVLRQMAQGGSLDVLPAILAQFGSESGLLGISIVNPKNERLKRWGWESPRTEGQPPQEASCAIYDISDGTEMLQLQFFLDATTGAVGPQARILLQLVADGAEALLSTPREVLRTPAPMPIELLKHGSE
jgi:UDP-GlcNAc:undecaprenyl-phosphate GlcNAc-1-phosphate transferase